MPPSVPSSPLDRKEESAFIKTLPGLLKLSEFGLGVLAFVCALSPPLRTSFRVVCFLMVSFTATIVSGLLLTAYILQIHERFSHFPWRQAEYISCISSTVLYLITSAYLTPWGGFLPGYGAASFFGFTAMTVFAVDTFFKFQIWSAFKKRKQQREQQQTASSRA